VIRYSADWVLPISSAPISRGFVDVDRGRITGVASRMGGDAVALGRAAILPGLVNAHTHLELSHLHGRIPPASRFLDWVRPMLALRREGASGSEISAVEAAESAILQARASGTVLIGDVSNTLMTVPLLRRARMGAQVFHELIGFSGSEAEAQVENARRAIDDLPGDSDVRLSLAPHAPYSVSPALFAAIRRDVDAHVPRVSTVHLGESPEEVEFLASGTGPWRTLLDELGVWNPAWRARDRSPVQYLADTGFLNASVLVVHGVQFDREDLTRLRRLGATLVSCPRSNVHVGVGSPPIESFYASGVDVAFGTDSLASVADLNLFSELAAARRLAPQVSARVLLRSATLTGARALGRGDEYGSIEPGKRAALIAVRVPDEVTDVEEYLVSGVEPDRVSRLDAQEFPVLA